jgi:hypothetical protein
MLAAGGAVMRYVALRRYAVSSAVMLPPCVAAVSTDSRVVRR